MSPKGVDEKAYRRKLSKTAEVYDEMGDPVKLEDGEKKKKSGDAQNFAINKEDRSQTETSRAASESQSELSEPLTDYEPSEKQKEALKRVLKAEESNFLHMKFVIVVVCFVMMLMFVLLTGVIHVEALKVCKPGYWGFFIAIIVFFAIASVGVTFYLRREYAYKVTLGYRFHENDA